MPPPNEPTSSTRHPRSLAASIACLILASSGSARAQSSAAQTPEAIRVRTEGADRCTTPDDFFARVHQRAALTRLASPDERARGFAISSKAPSRRCTGTSRITHLDGTSSTRDVTGESCDEVVNALRPHHGDRHRSTGQRAPTRGSEIVPAIGPLRPPEEPPDHLPRSSFARVRRSRCRWASRRSHCFGIPVAIELLRPHPGILSPSLTLGFERSFDRTSVGPEADASFDVIRGSVQGCPSPGRPVPFTWDPARGSRRDSFGHRDRGKRVATAGTDSRVWVGLDLAGRASPVARRPDVLGFAGRSRNNRWFGRYQFQVDPNISLGEVQRVNVRAALGLQVRFL